MQITTKSGRIVDTPDIRISTERKCRSDVRKADRWLLMQTKIECENNDWVMFFLNNMDAEHLTTSDKDLLNILLLPDGASEYIYELVKE